MLNEQTDKNLNKQEESKNQKTLLEISKIFYRNSAAREIIYELLRPITIDLIIKNEDEELKKNLLRIVLKLDWEILNSEDIENLRKFEKYLIHKKWLYFLQLPNVEE